MTHLLQFIRSTLDLAEDDLRRGEEDRVRHHLTTIRLLLDQHMDGGVEGTGNMPSRVRTEVRTGGGRPQTEEGRRVEASVKEMLKSGPKHIQELLNGLEKQDLKVGQGKAANLIAHLRRMEGVERQQRGVYRLAP